MKRKILKQRFTVDDVISRNPCGGWSRRKVEKYFGDKQSITLADLIDANISPAEYEWVLNCLGLDRDLKVFIDEFEDSWEGEDPMIPLFDCIIAYGLDNGFLTSKPTP